MLGALRILFELSYDYFVVLARSRVVFTVQLVLAARPHPRADRGGQGGRHPRRRDRRGRGRRVRGPPVVPERIEQVGIKRRALGAQLWMPLMGAVGVGLFAVGLGGLI